MRNRSLGMLLPRPAEISFSRSCNETNGISPSTYKTFRCRGADQRRRDSPAATANPMDSPSHDLPTPRGAYNIAKLRSGKIGERSISLAGTSRFKKSVIPIACRHWCFDLEMVCRIGIVPRSGKARCKKFLKFCNMKIRNFAQDTMPELLPIAVRAATEFYRSTAGSIPCSERLPR